MTEFSSTAIVLAAGLGSRMHPLTLNTPKSLLKIGGRTLLDQALDKLVAVGVKRVVVNTFHLADQIEAHLSRRYDVEIVISREKELLDTGGGVKNALHYFEGKPFFALNAEPPCIDGPEPSLTRMKNAWDPAKMDALLLLMPTSKGHAFRAAGDFAMDADGRAYRKNATDRPYTWVSAQILKPSLYDAELSLKAFSNNLIWDMAEATNTLYGIEYDGQCYNVSTPQDLDKANELLASGQGW